ncbi:protein kinase domain-containing protein [Alkaliphilus peptidifermentans]|uniref:Serine/threonine protein kinase n=1 Tax=Alkaliphilus peptidifermentans DSM 18978 TaxID=1120976 RepID=A0A1G5KGX0_9FIRM|nr:protein kinase [Alkaliphilus peptidifermentans]SCY99852.1 serine/threonine protein kinase [Alkaliphilus peptidifermentans DSM 18978]
MLALQKPIVGKWSSKKYKPLRQLGSGGTAKVFLVRNMEDQKLYAMKISQDSLSINREYQLLKKLHYMDFVVDVHDIDDLIIKNEIWNYLILEYIPGVNLKDYLLRSPLPVDTILGIIMILLEEIEEVHNLGYILGDLKLENLMMDEKNKKIRLIDLGGVVEIGGNIKEYTPAYDRAAWRCGERKAEASYDLFTILMILTRLIIGEKIDPLNGIKKVVSKINDKRISVELKSFLINSYKSQNLSIEGMKKSIRALYRVEGNRSRMEKELKRSKFINITFIASGVFLLSTFLLIAVIFIIDKL